jgi:Na+/H+ antiporter NhaD/arsenite permease-like protein
VAAGLREPLVAMGLSLLGSNTIGNVPLVTAALALAPDLDAAALYRLAAFSTCRGTS